MKEQNNRDFEELMFELSNFLAGKFQHSYSLTLNGCFWSVGPFLRKNHNNLVYKGDIAAFLCSLDGTNNLNQTKKILHCTPDVKETSAAEQNRKMVLENLIKESKSWSIHIKECHLKDNKIIINLDREIGFKVILSTVHAEESDYGKQACQKQVVSLTSDSVPDNLDLSQLRLLLTKELLIQIMKKLGYTIFSNESYEEHCIRLNITLNPALKIPETHSILCGVVRNSVNHKKESNVCADKYYRMRERDMQEASIHKYGSSALKTSWKGFISSMANSAVTLDLLHSRISQPVSLDMRESVALNREKSYKGAQFLLYNYARLLSILKQFNEKVKQGIYPPLVPIDAANFTLLSLEEEWMLLYNFIMPYPSLLVHTVDPKCQKFDTHVLIQFTQDLCKCVSAYYSRVHILTEPRAHLLPLMYARLYLISGIQHVMLSIFQLFNVVPVSQM